MPTTKSRGCEVVVRTSDPRLSVVHLTGESGVSKTITRTQAGVVGVWDYVGHAPRDSYNCDIEFRCRDGILFGHQAVLGLASKMLFELMSGQFLLEAGPGVWPAGGVSTITDRSKRDIVTFLLPDIDCDIMEKLLGLLYSGYIIINNTEAASKVKEVWKVLQVDIVELKKLNFEKIDPSMVAVKTERFSPTRVKEEMMMTPEIVMPNERRRSTRQVKTATSYFADDHNDDPDDPDPLAQTDEDYRVDLMNGNRPDASKDRNPARRTSVVKRKPGPASRIRIEPITGDPVTKKVKIENGNQKYNVEQIHNCVLCHGKLPDGKTDKEALNLSFRQMKKLKEHYSKCLYHEGKLKNYVDPEAGNTDAEGKVKDEFGISYKYSCSVKGCWKAKKKAEVGYKELALHNSAEHGVLEQILEEETRPELIDLLAKINYAKQVEIEETQPLTCKVTGCQEGEVMFKNTENYRGLKTHYSIQHFRDWFRTKDPNGEPRTQKATEPRRGTNCKLCSVKVFGDDDSMVEHYAFCHDRLLKAIMSGAQSVSDTRKILKDLFPGELPRFEKLHPRN